MGTTMISRRALAAILIVIVAVSITGISTYQVTNNQKFTQQSLLLGIILLEMGHPRIVSLAPNIDEMLCGLGLDDYIVGCTYHDPYGYGITMQDYYYPPRLIDRINSKQIDNSLNWYYPSLESVLALNPSIVLLDAGVSSQIQMFWPLISRGIIPILVSPGNNFAQIEESIWLLGILFGRGPQAKTLVGAMNTKIYTVINNVSGQVPLKVLFAIGIDFDTHNVYTCGGNTFQSEIITSAGGSNVFSAASLFPQKSFAEVQVMDPDVIIISATYYAITYLPILRSEIQMDPNLGATNASQSGAIYFIRNQADNIFMRAGPRVAEAVEVLANLLYGVSNSTVPLGGLLDNNNYQYYTGSPIPL